ncbi:uncharacterized protein LOC129594060 [Paramacrobiotus metropolitanus]|uniref:uncharacterized protein LOC129594060 n=1 Tax=Paramacrobiotus metropolitanus TaxID=2943436 RepID=UPI00244624F8|nr:uncharacterized protein LOC129594060 [Paramacrobiotus metropolitanus]
MHSTRSSRKLLGRAGLNNLRGTVKDGVTNEFVSNDKEEEPTDRSVPLPPKKRGRPRTTVFKAEESQHNETESSEPEKIQTETNKDDAPVIPKRRPGRPRKKLKIDDVGELSTSGLANELPADDGAEQYSTRCSVRKRGPVCDNPKKSKDIEPEESSEAEEPEKPKRNYTKTAKKSPEDEQKDGEGTLQKKRGRVSKLDKHNILKLKENDINGEPGICTRCGGIKATMDHFLRVHNAMLAEEERTFDLPAKRLRYLLVCRKKQKLRCQVPTCRKVMQSVTAMVYHEQMCGKTVERIVCPRCEKCIPTTGMRQHELEHDRELGIFRRKKFLSRHPEFVQKDQKDTEESAIKIEPSEDNQPSTSAGIEARPRRLCAIAAAKKLRKYATGFILDDSDEDQHYDSNSDEESEDDSGTDNDNEDAEDCDVDPEEKEVLPPKTFLPSAKFPRLDFIWKQSLEVLNYALCYNRGCEFLATSYPEIILHHKRCDFGPRNRHRLRFRCTVNRCKGHFVSFQRAVQHYMGKHGASEEDAKKKAKEKKVPHLVALRNQFQPSQDEIDALHLFD